MRIQMLAGTTVALALSACQQAHPSEKHPTQQPSVEQPKEAFQQQNPNSITEAEARRKLDEIPAPQWRFVRGPRYVAYHLVQQSGPDVSGDQFEKDIMCRNVFEAVEENMWALRSLIVTNTHPEMTSFMGRIGDRAVEVTLVKDMDRNAPSYLMIGGLGVIGSCQMSPG